MNSASALSRSAAALVRRLVLLSALLLSDSSHCPCSFRQARGDRGLVLLSALLLFDSFSLVFTALSA
eukprot:COSAG06_NODE_29368_length_558_cov_0.450980_1_plen_66_part_01